MPQTVCGGGGLADISQLLHNNILFLLNIVSCWLKYYLYYYNIIRMLISTADKYQEHNIGSPNLAIFVLADKQINGTDCLTP